MAMTTQEKWLLGGGLVGLAAITALAISLKEDEPKKKKKGYGLTVDPQCNTFTVNSKSQIRDSIRAEVRTLSKQGDADPFQATRAFLKKAAPHCTTYPNNTRNPGEASLFVLAFNSTLDVMENEKLLSMDQMSTFKDMVKVWAIDQGVPPGEF